MSNSSAEMGLEKSPNWDAVAGTSGFIADGFPFSEEFPSVAPGDKTLFTIIHRSGDRYDAWVDFSRQYQCEGIEWRTVSPTAMTLGQGVVAAWSRKTDADS